jgi:hypothetical protein
MDQLANFVAHTDYLPQAPATPDGQTSLSEAPTGPQRFQGKLITKLRQQQFAEVCDAVCRELTSEPGAKLPPYLQEKLQEAFFRMRLNPQFVEWMMGWPLSWTSHTAPSASRPAEMALWRSKLQSDLSQLLSEPEFRL